MKRLLLAAALACPAVASAQETCPSGNPVPTCETYDRLAGWWMAESARANSAEHEIWACRQAMNELADYGNQCNAEKAELTKERDIYHERAWKAEGKVKWYEPRLTTANRRITALRRACGARCNGL